MIVGDAIDRFHQLQPRLFPYLRRFLVEQRSTAGGSSELRLLLMMSASQADDARLIELVFEGVRDLKIDWPQWSVIRFSPIEVADIADQGLEDVRFRVFEGEGAFAFSCREFSAVPG